MRDVNPVSQPLLPGRSRSGPSPSGGARAPSADSSGSALRRLVTRRPVLSFVALVLLVAWPAFTVPLLLGWPLDPSKLVVTFGVMIGAATGLTAWTAGRAGVRNLFAGVTRWRVGWATYGLVLGGMPAATVAVAAVTGVLRAPGDGVPAEVLTYLLMTVVVGALVLNLWEETAWAGFVQTRLTAAHGLLGGALLTALPFTAIHLPLAFEDADGAADVALNVSVIAGTAVVLRYLAGSALVDTGGSVLAVGLLHASFNASGSLGVVDADAWWASVVALVLLTAGVAAARRLRGRSLVHGSVSAPPAPVAGAGRGVDVPPVLRARGGTMVG